MNTHGNLRPSCQYGAAGSQTLVPSAWGRCTCLAIPQTVLKRQSEIISKLWNISEKRRKQTRHPQRNDERHIPTEIERNLKIGMFFPISYNWLIDYRVVASETVHLISCLATARYRFAICLWHRLQARIGFVLMQVCVTVGQFNIYPPIVVSSIAYPSNHRRHRHTAYTHRM